MKSDSGGEMESCRSSDSELERELHEKEREIEERDRELTNCYRTIAERDTELIKVRLECQRLLEDNRNLREEIKDLKNHCNPKKQIEMEKEIDSLKWHLSVVSVISWYFYFTLLSCESAKCRGSKNAFLLLVLDLLTIW